MTTINTNVGALQARTYAVSSGARQQTSMERLSSGLRINSAADDAAGLAVANKMKSQLRGIEMAVRNSMDGVSLIQTAEAAMGEVTNMVIRMRELAVQMHNGVYTDADRDNAQLEVEALKSEIDKVCANTAFNDVKLLDGSFETYFRAGNTNQETVDVKIDGVCLDQLGGEVVDRRSISVIDEIPPDEPTDTFLETVRFEKARTTIEASEASQVTIDQSELGISELPLPHSGQYSLRGIDANEFTIDTTTGNITSVGAMDYEAPTGGVAADSTEYKFDVVFTASDGTEYMDEVTFKLLDGGAEPSTSGSVEVTLTEADNVVINTKGNRILSENFKGFIKADSASGIFELSGTDADEFSVDADGVITVIGGLDFENPTGGVSGNSNTYEFTYKYTSSTGQIYSETITLNVVDGSLDFNLTSAYDPIRVYFNVEGGSVSFTNINGLSFAEGNEQSDWQDGTEFTLIGSLADVSSALESATFSDDEMRVKYIVTPQILAYNPENQHLYSLITTNVNWVTALTDAAAQTYLGMTGHLATITSSQENDFIIENLGIERLRSRFWLGGRDVAGPGGGDWRWDAGPESGTQFWSGDNSGFSVNDSFTD
ncbi:hypothetical protein OAT45_05115 [Alphaproteobacteria bacterium]|nr:hypothetical protein [Alphaproteobacteria bacterium]